jgi:sugar O-acyltransferase (sialic acid O-acetyltransferase NeuD family)
MPPLTSISHEHHRLIVIGGGGFAREVIWLAREATQPWKVVGCLDDRDGAQGQDLSGVPVIGRVQDWASHPDTYFVVAIGNPRVRRQVVQRMALAGIPRFATLVHRSVQMSSFVNIGAGSMITAGCVLTTQIEVGRHVILNLSSTVGHDCVIADGVTVAPMVAISGEVRLEEACEIGTGTCIRQGLRIGRGAMVGMGTVVTRDVSDFELVVGSPARPLRQLESF